jgi:hypothetical protein
VRNNFFEVRGLSLDGLRCTALGQLNLSSLSPLGLDRFSFRMNWTSPSLISFLEHLTIGSTLASLTLNPLNTSQLTVLVDFLVREECSVVTLDISQNGFSDESPIYRLLSYNSSITNLDISYCDLLLKKTKCVSFSFSHFIFS